MIIIPDYLIIDEIRRREEQSRHPESLEIPIPSYDMPNESPNFTRENPVKRESTKKIKKTNGAIIIDMIGGHKI